MKTLFFIHSVHPSFVAMRKIRRLKMDLKIRDLSSCARANIQQEIENLQHSISIANQNKNF